MNSVAGCALCAPTTTRGGQAIPPCCCPGPRVMLVRTEAGEGRGAWRESREWALLDASVPGGPHKGVWLECAGAIVCVRSWERRRPLLCVCLTVVCAWLHMHVCACLLHARWVVLLGRLRGSEGGSVAGIQGSGCDRTLGLAPHQCSAFAWVSLLWCDLLHSIRGSRLSVPASDLTGQHRWSVVNLVAVRRWCLWLLLYCCRVHFIWCTRACTCCFVVPTTACCWNLLLPRPSHTCKRAVGSSSPTGSMPWKRTQLPKKTLPCGTHIGCSVNGPAAMMASRGSLCTCPSGA